jgi:hypothetical protein
MLLFMPFLVYIPKYDIQVFAGELLVRQQLKFMNNFNNSGFHIGGWLCDNYNFQAEVVRKLKFPNNSNISSFRKAEF